MRKLLKKGYVKNFFIVLLIIFIIIFIVGIINVCYCTNDAHRGIFPVNPYCTKCHGRDGIIQHECTNPNGIDKYCRSCGKILINQ